jgi:preprotein translocase subunit SecD
MIAGSLTAGILLTSLAAAPSTIIVDAPPALGNSLLAARRTLAFAGECIELQSSLRLEVEYSEREERYWQAVREAAEIWGNQIDTVSVDLAEQPRRTCSTQNVVAALRETDAALDAEAAVFRQITNGIDRGVWVGSLKLCRDTVRSTRKARNEVTGERTIFVRLTKQASVSFAAITDRSINQKLAIRLEGDIISRPVVNEQITGGSFQVQAADVNLLERAQTIISDVC